MTRYMLDTNTVSAFIKSHPDVSRRITQAPMTALCVSAITSGELMFGLAKLPRALRLRQAITEFLRRVDVLPWDGAVAGHYGIARAAAEAQGKPIGPLDMLIAAHAMHAHCTLVTHDAAFNQIAGLSVEDWTLS